MPGASSQHKQLQPLAAAAARVTSCTPHPTGAVRPCCPKAICPAAPGPAERFVASSRPAPMGTGQGDGAEHFGR